MLRSLFTGISGLRNHQTLLDVIGNNISNVNTVGFKKSRVEFRDLLYQSIQSGSAPQAGRGGTNPKQIGLGAQIAAISTIHTQGALENTGNESDLAIQGNGFFIVSDGSRDLYTRAGNFEVDANGNLVNPEGYILQGWSVDSSGNVSNVLTDVNIPIGQKLAANATTTVDYSCNLDSSAPRVVTEDESFTISADTVSLHYAYDTGGGQWVVSVISGTDVSVVSIPPAEDGTFGSLSQTVSVNGHRISITTVSGGTGIKYYNASFATSHTTSFNTLGSHDTSIDVYDSEGNSYTLKTVFNKVDDNTWEWRAYLPDSPSGVTISDNNGVLRFGTDGLITDATGGPIVITPTGAEPITITPDWGVDDPISGVTQFASSFTTSAKYQDGYTMGVLETYSVDQNGNVIGHFDNGQNGTLYRIPLALFNNPAGLDKVGDTLFAESVNSGVPQIKQANTGGAGSITAGALEMSNVDMAEEFTSMIIAQRGFEANARVITTADSILATLMNIKR